MVIIICISQNKNILLLKVFIANNNRYNIKITDKMENNNNKNVLNISFSRKHKIVKTLIT